MSKVALFFEKMHKVFKNKAQGCSTPLKFESYKVLLHIIMWRILLWLSDAHHISFLLNRFSVKCRFPFPNLHIFTPKSPSVTQRSVSQENAYKKSKNPSPFLRKTIGSNNSFTLIENDLRFLKIAKFEFKVTVHFSLWVKCTQLWALNLHLDENKSRIAHSKLSIEQF